MERRKVRNEFGLDQYNEQDVRNERSAGAMIWIFAGLAAFAFFAWMAFYTTTPTDTSLASNRPPAAATTGSGSPVQQQ
jgi:hypothetical protein